MEVKELTAAEAYRSSSHLRLTSPQLSVNMPAAAAFSLTIPLSIFGFRFISSSQAHDKPRVGLTARDPKMIHDKSVVGSCGHEDLLFVNSRHVGKVPLSGKRPLQEEYADMQAMVLATSRAQ